MLRFRPAARHSSVSAPTELGSLQVPLTTEHFAKLIQSEIAKWAPVVKAANIKVE